MQVTPVAGIHLSTGGSADREHKDDEDRSDAGEVLGSTIRKQVPPPVSLLASTRPPQVGEWPQPRRELYGEHPRTRK